MSGVYGLLLCIDIVVKLQKLLAGVAMRED